MEKKRGVHKKYFNINTLIVLFALFVVAVGAWQIMRSRDMDAREAAVSPVDESETTDIISEVDYDSERFQTEESYDVVPAEAQDVFWLSMNDLQIQQGSIEKIPGTLTNNMASDQTFRIMSECSPRANLFVERSFDVSKGKTSEIIVDVASEGVSKGVYNCVLSAIASGKTVGKVSIKMIIS
mgnify:CR=1 FL=1